MPSRESADLLYYFMKRDWTQIKYLSKKFLGNKYYRDIIWKDTISTKFWKKFPHTHKILEFEDEEYCFCTRCHRSWNLEDWKIEQRDQKLSQILKK